MKKKILSLILVLMLLPVASLFSACGKNKGYNLNNLSNDFAAIADENNNIKLEEGKFKFDYSRHNHLTSVINSVEPYTELVDYNYVFDNLMAFSYECIDECSYNESTDNVEIKNKVEENLKELKQSISNVNENVNMFAEIINISYNIDVKAFSCLVRYENLLTSYDRMFSSAINFNNSLADLYFNYILKDGNPNVYNIGLANFDANIVVNKLASRVKYQLSNLSQSYVELYIDSEEVPSKIANSQESLDLTAYDYKANVEALNKSFTEEIATEKANHSNNKETFFNLAVQAQNLQATLNNDNNKVVYAFNAVSYRDLLVEPELATANEIMCVSIILSNYQLITSYNQVLVDMLNIVA